jgi:hypothetical protein
VAINSNHQSNNNGGSSFISSPQLSEHRCNTGRPVHLSLSNSKNPILRKLAEYEALCNNAVVDRLMFFTMVPTTDNEARQLAESTATTLRQFADVNIEPLVVFEPSSESSTILKDISDGAYDEVINNYFQALHDLNISDSDMGTWVLMPEANTPTWYTTQPEDFVINVNKIGQIQKKFFPKSKVSILLNSRTYQDYDTAWNNGKLQSLIPYLSGMKEGLIDSFGYQGFPYISPANAAEPINQLDTKDFIPINLAIEAARKLKVQDIWLNTGTFSSIFSNDPEEKVVITPARRQTILLGITNEAHTLKNKGFNVSINLFAEDKSATKEHINWSYWQKGGWSESPDAKVLTKFLRDLRFNGIGFSLYDQE